MKLLQVWLSLPQVVFWELLLQDFMTRLPFFTHPDGIEVDALSTVIEICYEKVLCVSASVLLKKCEIVILVVQDQSMAFGSDRSRFTDIHFTGKR